MICFGHVDCVSTHTCPAPFYFNAYLDIGKAEQGTPCSASFYFDFSNFIK